MEKTSDIQITEQARSTTTMHTHHAQQKSIFLSLELFIKVGYFILHFLEMCVVMCVSLVIFEELSVWVGTSIGYSDLLREFPVMTTLALAVWFTLIMIGWMRLRRHEWRPSLEMASTSMFAVIPVVGAYRIGIVPQSDVTGMECGLSCAFMVVAMLLRLDHYTASHASHQQHVHATRAEI